MTHETKLLSALTAAALLASAAVGLAVWGEDEVRADITPEPTGDELGGHCPAGEASGGMGPEMAHLPDFCIDTTEVTRAQYDAWLETAPSADGQPAACADNADYESSCDSDDDEPVVCVDWCDARAYCEAAGKRLCGQVGTGEGYAFESYADPAVSEWQAACSSGGQYEYAYGDTLDTQICRGADAEDYMTWGFVDVGTLPGCRSPDAPYSEVSDLSGNAAEWDNGCDGDEPDSPCRIRGGSFEFMDVGLRCAMAQNLRWPRNRRVRSVGFRCCAD